MGCKESKHKAVAEGNTIITPSSSRKSMNRGLSSSLKSNVPSLHRSRSTRSTIKKENSLKKINVGNSKASNVLKENDNSGYEKGTVNVSKVLENEDRRLKQLNDQMAKSGENELMKGKNDAVETKENENVEQEEILIPKVNLPYLKDGGGIESIITDGLSGTSVYYTPTEASGPFGKNAKTENDEEKQEPAEIIKDSKSDLAEEAAEDNPVENVDATVEEAEVAEKNTIETDDATPEDHDKEAEVAEKIKVAEAAIAALENLVEADKSEDNDAATQYPVEETEEITDATLEKPVIEADTYGIIQETEEAPTDATVENPALESVNSEEIPEIEPEATDPTLSYPVIESDKSEESLLKEEAEAVENAVKEIHEVADKVEEIPPEEAASSDPTDHENQELVSDKAEDVQEKEAEAAEDPANKDEVADQEKNLGNEAEAVSIHDEASTEEDTKNSSK
ncbi:hypothetical protein AgCh_002675 [Apium graveolens]